MRAERRRPSRTPAEWVGARPERIVGWAFALGLMLILIADHDRRRRDSLTSPPIGAETRRAAARGALKDRPYPSYTYEG